MIVSYLSLRNFRNYETAELELVPGANLFVGSNGQGKTNLVESLGYLSTLGSHRVSQDHAMIRAGQDAAIVRSKLVHGAREFLVELQLNRQGANKAQVNRGVVKTRDLPRYFSSVLFAPEDLALVRGEPSGRRRFLDQLLVSRTPRLAGVISDYERVLKQRNTLLKSARNSGLKDAALSTLDLWDQRLIELGSEIIWERLVVINELRPFVASAYLAIAGSDHHPRLIERLSILSANGDDEDVDGSVDSAELIPHAGFDVPERSQIQSAFVAAVARVRRSERDRGITLVGPHRDDVLFELNALPAKGYASHGESWSFALAIKLASAELLRHESPSGDPVVILDDVFAELDRARRERLAVAVANYEQVLITAAVLEDVPEALTAHTVHIRKGQIVDGPETTIDPATNAESDE